MPPVCMVALIADETYARDELSPLLALAEYLPERPKIEKVAIAIIVNVSAAKVFFMFVSNKFILYRQ
jgi:hypothetical protein